MEQLVMKTQQSTDVKLKKHVKKADLGKENEADFGKALEQFAAYSQQPVNAEEQQSDALTSSSAGVNTEGVSGIQANGMAGMLNLEDLAKALKLGTTASPNTDMQLQGSAPISAALQNGVLTDNEVSDLGIFSANKQDGSKLQENVQILGTEIQTENSADLSTTQLNVSDGENLQNHGLSRIEKNGKIATGVETDEKDAVNDVLSLKSQEYRVADTQLKGLEGNSQTQKMNPEYADMLKDMIANQITSGKQEIEIRLTPRSLGDLIVKVAYQDGAASVSIICSDKKALQAMSQRAGELGMILENNLGSRTEVVVESREEHANLYEDGRGQQSYSGQQSSKEQHSDNKQNETETIDFLQQLRLGIRKESELIWQ